MILIASRSYALNWSKSILGIVDRWVSEWVSVQDYIYVCTHKHGRCLWYNYRKWTRQPEFEYWTRFFAFHFSLIPLDKGINPTILPPALSKIVGQTRLFSCGMATSLEGKLNSSLLNCLKNWPCVTSNSYRRVVNTHIHIYWQS